jgi:hypothetical protein
MNSKDDGYLKYSTVSTAIVMFTSGVNRDDAGAFLCIASNGVQPSISKRITLRVLRESLIITYGKRKQHEDHFSKGKKGKYHIYFYANIED